MAWIKVRNEKDSYEFREKVLKRDKYVCQKSGRKKGKLVAHHINNYEDFPKLRSSIDNGITLSDNQHRKFHIYYGKKGNTRQQLNEFLAGGLKIRNKRKKEKEMDIDRNYRMSQDTDKKLKAIKKKVDKNWDGTFRAMIEAFNQTNRVS